ncbi:hypothetical protein [Cellulomonas pakistanensis]|uniref:Uncharacterized protein n=1 Tax=Cellulomonas pakistanensis TaxID=992287 RepID=A0A919PBT8_9CELL|nr:hypothetical protein [Cellulomonas pakistanensis]GIG37641.1 hypothetical protein Cpa01nite_30220 [Cellulomonas pakistanensis]
MNGQLTDGLAERLHEAEDLVRRTTAELARLDEPDERDTADARRRAEAARSGSLGPDWQRVQQRIDGGRTTLSDVFSGTDTSPEAQRLVGRSRAVLTEARADAQDDPTGMTATVLRDMDELRERLRDVVTGRRS